MIEYEFTNGQGKYYACNLVCNVVLLDEKSLNSILKEEKRDEVVGDVTRLVGLQPTHQHSAKTALLTGLT